LPKSTDLPWRFEAVGPSIHRLTLDMPRADSEAWGLLTSDVHWDNPKSDRDAYARHLAEARERRAFVIDNGDFYCAMQGKYDKRSSKSAVRPEHQTGSYLDALVNTAADWLRPFAAHLTTMGTGNHESSIHERHETDLTDRLCAMLRANGSPATRHGYAGFVAVTLDMHGRRHSFKLFRTHGYGGGGPVTKDIIQTSRQAVYLADADIVVSGHTHDQWVFPIQRMRLSQGLDRIEQTRQVHVKVPGYKDHYGQALDSWEIGKGHPPKPRGAWWIRFYYTRGQHPKPEFELIEAKA
jgi:hypothetical protein